MFIKRPEEGGEAGQDAEDEPDADGDLAEHDQVGEPGLGAVVEEELQEAAVPLVGDRRAASPRGSPRRGPSSRPRAVAGAVHPGLVGELVPAGIEPREAQEQADRQPEQAGLGVAEQEPREGRSLDLDGLAARLLALHEQEHEQDDERDPEPVGDEVAQGGLVVRDLEPRVDHDQQQDGGQDPDDLDRHRQRRTSVIPPPSHGTVSCRCGHRWRLARAAGRGEWPSSGGHRHPSAGRSARSAEIRTSGRNRRARLYSLVP